MVRDHKKTRPPGERHFGDEELLMYLDGELLEKDTRQVSAHLRGCWRCRTRSEQIERAITRFVEHRSALAESSPPPGQWRRFEAVLQLMATDQPDRTQLWRQGFLPRLAVALASVLLILVWVHIRPVTTVSATEILARAETAERLDTVFDPDPVVYKRVRVSRRMAQQTDTATVESWSDLRTSRHHRSGGEDILRDLETVLEKNAIAGRGLLSTEAFRNWRAGLAGKNDEVTLASLPDGSEALTIRTVSRDEPYLDSIVEAALVVRTRDWHAVEQSLRVAAAGGAKEFQLIELAFHLTTRRMLDPAIFGDREAETTSPVAKTPSATAAVATPETPQATSPEEAELLTLHALHVAGACLGEPVAVVRDEGGGVTVQGLVDTAERKQALMVAVQAIPLVRFAVQTVEEAMAAPADADALPGQTDASAPIELRPGEVLLAGELKHKLRTREIVQLSDRAVTLTRGWMAHAWALHRLAESMPDEKVATLSDSSRRLLERVAYEHANALRGEAASLRLMLAEVWPDQTPPPSEPLTGLTWESHSRPLFEQAQTAERLVYALFTGSAPLQQPVPDAVVHLMDLLSNLEDRAASFENGTAVFFHANVSAYEAETRRQP
jgi:hypothetical protein